MIRINGIRKVYDTGAIQVEALKGIDLHVEAGDFVAIMGASGSGKSTLMNILGCLDRTTAGTYHLDSVDVSGLTDNELAQIRNEKIGFIFQSFNLLPRMSSLKNVELPMVYRKMTGKERRDAAVSALERVGLGDRMEHQPNELSGGQRQRVAIARALAGSPSVLLADEPTGNLDSKTSYDVMELFKELNAEGNTIVLVTHEPDIAEQAKRIVVVKDGLIVEDRRTNLRETAQLVHE